jgi:ABC-2 type transport system permease protein
VDQAVFFQALREYLRPKRVLPWIVLALACAGLAYSWRYFQPDSSLTERYSNVALMLVFRMLALISAIFTTAIVSQEVEQRTIVYLLTRPIPRWRLLLIRYAASVIVVGFVGLFAITTTSFGAFGGITNNPLFWNDVQAIIVGAVAYGALFLLFSLLFNRAMLVCLLFAFGWETAVPNMRGFMDQLSIVSHLQAISQHPQPDDPNLLQFLQGTLGTNTISAQSAFGVMGIFTVVLLGICAWWFSHFEYVPREDAE